MWDPASLFLLPIFSRHSRACRICRAWLRLRGGKAGLWGLCALAFPSAGLFRRESGVPGWPHSPGWVPKSVRAQDFGRVVTSWEGSGWWTSLFIQICCCSSVTMSCLTLCDPVDSRMTVQFIYVYIYIHIYLYKYKWHTFIIINKYV